MNMAKLKTVYDFLGQQDESFHLAYIVSLLDLYNELFRTISKSCSRVVHATNPICSFGVNSLTGRAIPR